ncbi:MAG: class I SAM-dependent methyltransferase [Balneolaceae bacterium]|nr:MAG: class I SAM-dependent methyltransferase [Balneolaceae bacterium]
MKQTQVTKPPYSSLADIYDEVMHNVDYESWADYLDEIILQHQPEAAEILELACGTGTIALSLEELDCYNITATDASADMIRIAKKKGVQVNSEIHFHTMDFLNINLAKTFDVVFMVFDSLNYLHNGDEIIKLHNEVRKVLKPDGIFVYDFTTPRNSRKAISYLNNESKTIDRKFRYFRESSFDGKNRIHTNLFRIQYLNHKNGSVESTHEEIHHQKIYTIDEMETIIKQTDFTILQAYDGFELKPAHEKSLRITMVLQ